MNNGAKPTAPSEALILAGGLGTRLRGLLPDIPKPLAPVGGRPFLAHLLDYWQSQGISRFVISVGYRAEQIIEYFGHRYGEAQIDYVREDKPLGTGGALALTLRTIAWRGQTIIALNGDTYLAVSLQQLSRDSDPARLLTLVLKPIANNERYDRVTVDEKGLVTAFGLAADPSSIALVNTGCYHLSVESALKSLSARSGTFSLERDWLAALATEGLVGSSVQDIDFIDIGVPKDYQAFCQRFA